MKKIILTFIYICCITLLVFAQTNNTRTIILEIHNVAVNGGTLYVSVSFNENSYKNYNWDFVFEFAPTDTIVIQEINLPIGECVINIHQDINNNGIIDTGFLGIPKEPVGISNWNGNGPPGNFRRHKINIDAATTVVAVNLYQL